MNFYSYRSVFVLILHMIFKWLAVFSALLMLFSGASLATTGQATSISRLLQQWNAEITQINKALANPEIDDESLNQFLEQLNKLRSDALTASDQTKLDSGPLQTQLTALGPPPAAGAPPESNALVAKRKELNDRLMTIQGQLKEIELIVSAADQSLDQISALRIHRFTQRIFSRGPSPLMPEVWKRGIPDLQKKLLALENQINAWQSAENYQVVHDELVRLLIALISVLLLVWPFSRWFLQKFGQHFHVQIPSYLELLQYALTIAVVRTLVPMSIVLSAYLVLVYDLQLQTTAHDVAYSTLKAFLMIILVGAVSRALLAPFKGRWRLMPLNDADAYYVHKVILGLAWVFAIDMVLDTWFAASGASLDLTILRKFLINLLIAALLLALLIRRQLWRMDIQHRRKQSNQSWVWRGLRALIGVLVLMIPVSALAGYVPLSRLLGTQIVLTGGLYILVGVVIALCSELIEELLNPETELGAKIRQNLELTDDGCELLLFWLKAAVLSIVYIAAIISLLVIWGAGGEDLNVWLHNALFGFTIAGINISITTIFLAIALFSVGLLLTRLLQRFLEHVILPKTRIDAGIQNSIRASVGYIGFVLASAIAVSTLGIDLSKLAIIVGALSVGIGFGLQNVVNNFVSGLILLIERPIKVGDWVVVNDKQGYVKNINVRATEISTFDRASVFIPNSDLISNPLLNWTHADKTGRVIIPVGVAYGSDTRLVERVLLSVADEHPAVLKSLTTSVLFKGFGDSGLNFELRAFVQDVDKVLSVSSDLCFAIDAAFRKSGIEIPYPQQDIHFRDMDKLEKLITKILVAKRTVNF